MDLARVVHDEAVALEQAGAKYIQIDEPAISTRPDEMEMASRALGIVTEGLATGQSPRVVATEISRSIRSIGVVRGRVIARTETLRAHATATLTRFEQSGIETVEGFAEFVTAGDDRVCQTCQDLEGRRFPLSEAAGIIPVHPNCRCVWLPVTDPREPSFRTPEFFDRFDR